MSKSLGNFVTIHELLHDKTFGGRTWPGEVLRLAMLRTHYRQPIDWTARALEESEKTLDRWYAMAARAEAPIAAAERFLDALSDDLNTPAAVAELFNLFHADADALQLGAAIASARLLGLMQLSPQEWIAAKTQGIDVDAEKVEALIAERLAARAAKNWAESDRLRDELVALNVVLKDNKDGTTTWEVKR
jgi:cysteinyl-tRNA synthetase